MQSYPVRSRKAFVKILEVSIASFILFIFIALFSVVDDMAYDLIDLEMTVYESFEYLYLSGTLGQFAVSSNLTGFNDSFRAVVSPIYNFDVGLKNSTAYIVPQLPDKSDIYVYQYLVSGSDTTFSPTVFSLYVW
ncbi:MAG: hypothetical protein K0B02_00940 [DPANN group archaeon]|nr:hypothetical protein [DPANN group archaeon]